MFRKDLWLTLSLFAFGTIGGVFYNYYCLRSDSGDPRDSRAISLSDNRSLPKSDIVDTPIQTAPTTDVSNADDLNIRDQRSDVATSKIPIPSAARSNASNLNSLASLITESDRYLTAGNFHDAHRLYARASEQLTPNVPGELLFKLGLSAELAGDLRVAKDCYGDAVRRSSHQLNTRLLAMIGLARIKSQNGEADLSKEILSDLFLRYEGDSALPHEVVFQLRSQIAWTTRQQFLNHKGVSNPVPLEFFADELNLEATIRAVGPSAEESAENAAGDFDSGIKAAEADSHQGVSGLTVLQRPSSDAELIALDASTPNISIRDALSQLAAVTELKFELDSFAESTIRGRSTKLNVSGVSLALILDNLANPIGLVWHQSGDVIKFSVRQRSQDSDAFDFLSAVRAQRAIAIGPDGDERGSSALLALGNLHLIAGNYDQAALYYEQLAQLGPNGELLAKLSFNRAIMERSLGRYESATRLLYESIDQSLDFHLQSISYFLVSNLQLQNDDIQQAIQSSARSLSLASDHQVRRDAALNLARAYLLNNDPYSANKVLFENFDLINTSQRSSVVGFLSSFARYLGTSDKVSQSKARERLMISLIMIKDSDLETIFDKLIASRAYSEMGLIQRSNQLLKLAENENSVDRWRRKIEFQLAIQQFDDIDDHQAIKILSRLAKDASDSVGQNAALRLAKYELHHNQYQACLKRCHLLTQTASDQQIIIEALKVMGSAYRRLGQHRSAAVCFSGMVPELFVSQSNPAQNPEGPTQQ